MLAPETAEPPTPDAGKRPRRRLLLWGGLLLAFLVLAVRLAWVASRTETGWETISQQWRDATVGLVLGDHVPVGSLEPIDQAEFWLRETDRILAADPDNAELAMGAALVLDSPGWGFIYRYTKPNDSSSDLARRMVGTVFPPELDQAALDRAINQFEERCRANCLALAARATDLQPKELRWWRLRALLLIQDQAFGGGRGPRSPDWLRDLARCAEHDPDNALYDYIAAWQCLAAGIDNGSLELRVVDKPKFDQAMEHLHEGLKKPFCAGGDGETTQLTKFVARSRVPHVEQAEALGGSIPIRMLSIMRDPWRVQLLQAEQREKSGDLQGALALERQAIRYADQFVVASRAARLDFAIPSIRSGSYATLRTLLAKYPRLVSTTEVRRIKAAATEADLEQKALLESGKRLSARRHPSTSAGFLPAGLLTSATVATVPLLLLLAVCAAVLAARLRKGGEQHACQPGPCAHASAWLAGYALSFIVLGMFPAEIVPPAVQGWIILGSIALFATVTVGWIVWRIMVRRRFQYTIRTMLIVTFFWALFLGLLRTFDIIPFDLSDLSLSPHVAARGWRGLDAGTLQKVFAKAYGAWAWAAAQWFGYYGHHVAIGLALAVLAFWHHLRAGRAGTGTPPRKRDRWASLLRCLGRSMLAAAIVWLLVYLAIAPSVVQSAEDAYQTQMEYLRNPQAYYDAMTKTMAEVRADWSWMKPDTEKGGGQ
jgi:hypothetical protein